MPRLPQPGKDAGQWGEILNDFLDQSHDQAGNLKTDTVGASQLKPLSVTSAALANGSVSAAKISDGGITSDKLAPGLISEVGLSGDYSDLANTPTIPAAAADINAEPAGLSAGTKEALAAQFAPQVRTNEVSLRAVCDRTMVTSGTLSSAFVGIGKSNGIDTRGMYRTRHFSKAPFHTPRMLHSNIINNNGTEAGGDNPITVSASIELPASAGFIPVTWGGQLSITIAPGATVESDPLGFSASLTQTPAWYSRTYVRVASAGMTWPLTLIAGTGDAAERGTVDNDKTQSGTMTTAYERTYGPSAIVGVVEDNTPSVLIVGDSQSQGYNETNFNSFLVQALQALNVPYIIVSAGSEQSGAWVNNQTRFRRSPFARFATHVIVQDGFNSLNTPTYANVENTQRAVWAYFTTLGLPVAQTTILPGTSSTNSWATTAGQTNLGSPKEPNRVLLNTLIRTQPAPLSAVIEIADVAMTARDSGIWKSDGTANKWTNDGAHPSTYGHAQIALDPTVLSQLRAFLGLS